MEDETKSNKRADLPPLERAVSDTLDKYLFRLHGIITSWTYPEEFMLWLNEAGYEIRAKENQP